MLNSISLIGHLGRNVEVRSTQAGDRIASFSLATSERWTDKASGERRERSTWHNIVVFNPHLVEIAEKYLRKGSKAFVQGSLQTREWADKEGSKRTAYEVVLTRFKGELVLLDGKPSDDREERPSAAGAPPGSLDDEIPFAPLRELP